MKTRILHTKFWNDSFISDLTPTEKLLFLYYLTNESVNIIHCYECSDRKVMFDTGIDRATIAKAKEKFQSAGKIYFKEDYVFLKNASKYEQYSGDKNDKAKELLLKQLNDEIRAWIDSPIDTPIDRGSIETINHKSEIINPKSEKRGIVKGEYFSKDELTELQDEFPTKKVEFEYASMKDYLASKGKTYKDYKAFFRNWLRRSKDLRTPPKQYAPPLPELPPEERRKALKAIDETRQALKEKLSF